MLGLALHCALALAVLPALASGEDGVPTALYGEDGGCIIYRQNHYGFMWNIVHTIEFASYNPGRKIFIDYSTNSYQCEGLGRQSWWHWLNSSAVRPLAEAPPDGCAVVSYFGDKGSNPTRFVDWVLDTRAEMSRRTGLWDLAITFGPVNEEQQATREGLMRELRYLQRLPEVVPQLWVPAPALTSLVDYEWGLLDRLRKPIVGIHVRGGDKHAENQAMWGAEVAEDMRDSVKGMQALAARHGEAAMQGTCVVVGDGHKGIINVIRRARAILKCEIVNMVYPHTDYERSEFLAKGHDMCLAGTHVFVLIELLARADFTVGSLHNAPYNVASFVRQFKYGKEQATCIDNANFGQPTFLY